MPGLKRRELLRLLPQVHAGCFDLRFFEIREDRRICYAFERGKCRSLKTEWDEDSPILTMLRPPKNFLRNLSAREVTEGREQNRHQNKSTVIMAQAAKDMVIVASRSARAVGANERVSSPQLSIRVHKLTEREEHKRPCAFEPRLRNKLEVLDEDIEATAPPRFIPFLHSTFQTLLKGRELVRMQRAELIEQVFIGAI